jgi:hypothetical protein
MHGAVRVSPARTPARTTWNRCDMQLPPPHGPVSAALRARLSTVTNVDGPLPSLHEVDILADDAQLSLWLLHRLPMGGFEGVPGERERDLDLLAVRHALDDEFERVLRAATGDAVRGHAATPGAVGDQLMALVAADDGPSLASYLLREADREQMLGFLRQRSIFGLKESDPQALMLPILQGAAKVALAEILYDEFGAGRPERLHQRLYAEALEACGLEASYGAYLPEATAETLATDNVMSLFARQHRLRGAAAGHFAAFEATSAVPSRKIAGGMERLGLPRAAADYFLEHVEADSVHEQVAAHDVCGALVAQEPGLREDVLFGAAACLYLDGRAAAAQLAQWSQPAAVDGRAAS